MATAPFPLLDAHPALRARLPRLELATLPTPVRRMSRLEERFDGRRLYIKRDDLCSPVFGGNKTRKLELILGALAATGQSRVITFGFAGSNHAAATALFCREIGVRCIAMLMPQPPSDEVRRNLLAAFAAGAQLRLYPSLPRVVLGAMGYRITHRGRRGSLVPMISAGGTTPEGNAAYVNAAFELAAQIEAGVVERPHSIHVAAGSLGTAAGLLAGMRAAGLGARLVPVRVTEERFASEAALAREVDRTTRFLGRMDPGFPGLPAPRLEVAMDHACFGDGYGVPTPAGIEAARILEETEGIRLDGTYGAKAFASFLKAAASPCSAGRALLFWNTCGSPAPDLAGAPSSWRELPEAFHRYFV